MINRLNRIQKLAIARIRHIQINYQVKRNSKKVAVFRKVNAQLPVVIFNASTRLRGISLNAAFSLLTSWSLQLQGIPVRHFVCQEGLSPCVLGTNRKDTQQKPPCSECVNQSGSMFNNMNVNWFRYEHDLLLSQAIEGKSVNDLLNFKYEEVPLGNLVLPSIRWIMRRNNLLEETKTLEILKGYIRSAWSIKSAFERLIKETYPRCVLVFNGMMYPEAVVRWVASQHGIPSFSHEVGMTPFSGFFTQGEATAYPVTIPDDFQLNEEQNAKLDAYLEKRFNGKFTMAGLQFWREISSLDSNFLKKANNFKQIVPVFTNVIFDTSQPHANIIFTDMFEWLDQVALIAKRHTDTLFIFRAHPDEARQGKASEESVADWVQKKHLTKLHNVIFVRPDEFFSSYEMIQRAKFIMIYNSTIGLEASIMGKPVLCAGKARFTQLDTVFFPKTTSEYLIKVEDLLNSSNIDVPPIFQENARRFLFYQLFRTSLPFGDFIEDDDVWNGYVKLKQFDLQALLPQNSPTMRAIHDGLLMNGDFLVSED